MGVLQNRQDAFEGNYFHNHELSFLDKSRRTRLFALDLADAMGYDLAEAEQYSARLIAIFAENGGSDQALIDQVLCDLHDIGIAESRVFIEKRLLRAEVEADKIYKAV